MRLPQIQFKQYNGLNNPSGSRNLDVAASGFIKLLDTTSSGVLDFGYINITTSGSISPTKCLIFRPLTMGDAGQLYNFRFYLPNITAWGLGTYNFYWGKAIHFTSGTTLTISNETIPTVLPPSGNVLSTHSGIFIQTTTESGVSQYIYLAVFAGQDVPIGQKGGPGNGGFRYRLTYDFL